MGKIQIDTYPDYNCRLDTANGFYDATKTTLEIRVCSRAPADARCVETLTQGYFTSFESILLSSSLAWANRHFDVDVASIRVNLDARTSVVPNCFNRMYRRISCLFSRAYGRRCYLNSETSLCIPSTQGISIRSPQQAAHQQKCREKLPLCGDFDQIINAFHEARVSLAVDLLSRLLHRAPQEKG